MEETRVLLDTHAFLWAASEAPELGPVARTRLSDPTCVPLLSIASIWEMAIKVSLGKLRLRLPLDELIRGGVREAGVSLLPIRLEHALGVTALPFHHRDPFDRLLAAQALSERVPILSADAMFDAYGVRRLW